MTDSIVSRNEVFLEKLRNGEIPEDEITIGVGSFLMLLFREEEEDCIPLFFEFLSWYTGEDYSNELEWVQDCLKKGHDEYSKFEEILEENPLLSLMLALSV